ncbi:hypothetical protein AAFC00_002443 [Neodothiora populina]|uniref:Catechol dioxygenase n=1 Tax=Neodothiora populina TaxID=2781224 RepID=A0ABR3P785_9PEZI
MSTHTAVPEDTLNGAGRGGNLERYDPEFTDKVINAMGPKTNPRLRTIMTSLIRHVHDFARECDLTVDEWMMGVNMINRCGQMSDDKRNESQLLCDVIGLETLVDEITFKLAGEATDLATQSAILGPFYRHDVPLSEMGTNISDNTPNDAVPAYMFGKVTSAKTGKPLANVEIDIWQASTNGLYEQQDPEQKDCNLRGRFKTGPNGEYSLYCLKPTPYPVPDDGPAGELLNLMDRQPFRPAHIHILAQCEGHKPIITQIFDKDSKFLDDDSVFAVKDALVVTFDPRKGDKLAQYELHYDVVLKSM